MKKDSATEVRPYVDCSQSGVNDFMAGWGVRDPTAEHALQAAPTCGFLGKRDWSAGFHHCKLREKSRRLTGFRHPVTGRVGRFVVASFGIPQCLGRYWEVANELLRIAAEELKRRGLTGVTLVGYVDDVLIMAATHEEVVATFQLLDELGEELGVSWKLSKDEGREEPRQRVSFVGVGIDVTGEPELFVEEEKRHKYLAQVRRVLAAVRGEGRVERSEVRTVVGQLAFTARACRWGRAHLAGLYAWQDVGGKGAMADDVPARGGGGAGEALLDEEGGGWEGRTRWSTARWDLVKGTHFFEQGGDAAGEENLGWGAQFGYERAAGDFAEGEKHLHIAWKELLAVIHGFKLWSDHYAGRRVVVWTDNISVAVAINAGTTGDPVGRRLLKELALMAVSRGIDVRAKHIAGKLNVVADDLSRRVTRPSSADYTFAPGAFEEAWGAARPEVDMFCDAQGRNAQELEDCGQETAFFSAQRPAEVEDVVSRRVWFNPPWALVGEALEKVARAWREDPRGTYAVGVVPVWRHKWWWTRFVERRKAPFRVLRVYPEGTDALFLCTGSRAFRAEGEEAPAAGETPFELAVVAIGRRR